MRGDTINNFSRAIDLNQDCPRQIKIPLVINVWFVNTRGEKSEELSFHCKTASSVIKMLDPLMVYWKSTKSPSNVSSVTLSNNLLLS